jgi:hypothetical protein
LLGKHRSISLCASQAVWPPVELAVFLSKLFDLEKLVLIHVGEMLSGVAGRPPYFQIDDSGFFAQADVLL